MFPTASTADASQTAEEMTNLKSTINFQDMAYWVHKGSSLWAWQAGYTACQHPHVLLESKGNSNQALLYLHLLFWIYTSVRKKESNGFVKGSPVTFSPRDHAAAQFGLRVIRAVWNQTQMQDARERDLQNRPRDAGQQQGRNKAMVNQWLTQNTVHLLPVPAQPLPLFPGTVMGNAACFSCSSWSP